MATSDRERDVPSPAVDRPGLAGATSEVRSQDLARTALRAVQREYPNAPHHEMHAPHDRPTPRQAHPCFYGCYDWHSAVEMHWALAVLVSRHPTAAWAGDVRAVLDGHLTAPNLRVEADYLRAHPRFERPYGWGWLLQLAAALDGSRRESLQPLVDVVEAAFVAWLPRPPYPDRSGTHGNTAFALARALPHARSRRDGRLLAAIHEAAARWFGSDRNYSCAFEPGGADFLSPTLTEIVLMRELLAAAEFETWFDTFTGGVIPEALTDPVQVTDPQDGHGAHLLGLNLYRIHALRRLGVEPGAPLLAAGAQALSASGWMAQHWLPAFGVLAFDADEPG